MLTVHAKTRSHQRAIPPMLIDLLLQFGSTEKAPGGTEKLYFDKSARKRIRSYAGPLAGLLESHLGVYAVVNGGDVVVTVGHRIERIKRR